MKTIYTSQLKNRKKKLRRNRFLDADWLTNLPQFHGARPDHVRLGILRRNPPEVRVTSGQKPCTKITYIVLKTSVGLFSISSRNNSFLTTPNVENKCWTSYETLESSGEMKLMMKFCLCLHKSSELWLKAMDSRKLVGSVLLDLSKAFDLVDHDLLLSKIDKYHVTNVSQEWFKSYLSNRTQRCCINGSLSDALVLARGVPQGSIFGPILLSLYINDLPIGISNSNVDIYADDTTIWETNSDPLLILRGLQDSLDRTSSWLSLNKMVPNTKKTKHLIIGTVQKLLHSGNISLDLSLCGTPIEEAKVEKLLGVKIDKHLNWDNLMDFLIDKLNSTICLLKRAKTYLNHRLRNLLYNEFIRPLFEYCCTVWGSTKNENLFRLLRVQKRCARLILDASFSDASFSDNNFRC